MADGVQIDIDPSYGTKAPMIGGVMYTFDSAKKRARLQWTNRQQFRNCGRRGVTIGALKEALILGRQSVTDALGIEKLDRMIELATREMEKQRALRSARKIIHSALSTLKIG